MSIHTPSRALTLCAAIATAAVALVALPAVVDAFPVQSASAATLCSPVGVDTAYGNVRGVPPARVTTEDEVGVYIDGAFTVGVGAQEAEGVFVVRDNAVYNPGAGVTVFNQGSVGIGSQVVPADGSDMLNVGGNVVVTTSTLQVGTPNGGKIRAGGTITGSVDNYPGVTHESGLGSSAVLTPYAAVPTMYTDLSDAYALLPDTGTVTTGANVIFDGDGTSARQVFTVSGSQLGTLSSDVSILFSNIPANAIIVVNVTGTSATLSVNTFFLGSFGAGAIDHYTDPRFSPLTQSLVWNFSEATGAVTLGNHGQLLGSIIAPNAATTNLLTTTNGRVYVGGNLNFADGRGGAYTGMEFHNYPFRDRLCAAPGVGSLTITKALTDPDAVVPATRSFSGTYSCSDSTPAVVASGTWSVVAGATSTVTGIPAGATCSVTENALTTRPSASDPTYSWAAPAYSANVTIAGGATSAITVTNAVERAFGRLAITKTLVDDDGVVTSGRVFSGAYRCLDSTSAVVRSGTWSQTVGAAAVVIDHLPVGATCSLTETSLGAPPSSSDSSYLWQAPVFSPATVTIADGVTSAIEVQNTVRRGLGDLQMRKVLDDPFDVVDLARVYTGTWSCTFNAAVIESGTWSTTAGAAAVVLATDIPMGSTCVLAEDAATLAAPPLAGYPQYIWRAPTISPATVTIADGVLHTFTVTNTVYDPIAELSHAGTDSWLAVGVGGVALGGGILLLWFGRRRRLATRG